MPLPPFHCKKFHVNQAGAAHPVGTDSILIGSWADISNCQSVLDIGTGTGIIALMLAQRLQEMGVPFQVDAVEIDPSSAATARANFTHSDWAAQLNVWEGPVQELTGTGKYDLIVSNPPFFAETILSPNQARRQARSTVTLHFSDLIETALRLLAPNGRFCVVLPVQEGQRLYQMAAPMGLYHTRCMTVFSKKGKAPERLLMQLERNPYRFKREELLIHAEPGLYSEAYQKLTKDFYLAF